MKEGYLSTYFDGVVAKRLSSVEANLEKSNQHEFNGVSALKKLLGDDRLTDCLTHFVWLGEENEGITENSYVTWYDSRENHPTRSEYRLYFRDNAVMSAAQAGDLLIIAKSPRGQLMIVVAGANSTVENQLLWLFGVSNQLGESFQFNDYQSDDGVQIDFAARYILEELGIEVEEPETDRLDALLEQFNGVFPTTVVFSKFARETLPEVIPQDDPDGALLAWMDREEKLFRRMERHIVADRLRNGFVENDDEVDVNGFLKFSLSVQNRRKSRAGYALENHLEAVFTACEIRYDSQAVTENRSKPDFLFPGLSEYKDSQFPSEVLTMLGVKSTCKDRWRQVLSEAARIQDKHLFTLEPGISQNQTDEMKDKSLQLVLPNQLHATYSGLQQEWLMNLDEFICMVRERQIATDV